MFLGVLGITVLVSVLGLAVWRIQSQKTTITRPKATAGAGQCLPSNQTHLECVNSSCVRKIGVGNNLNGCVTVGSTCATCPSGQTPCSGVCKDLQIDPNNCGACGTACATGQVCTSGSCVTVSSTCNVDPDCSGGNVCAFP